MQSSHVILILSLDTFLQRPMFSANEFQGSMKPLFSID